MFTYAGPPGATAFSGGGPRWRSTPLLCCWAPSWSRCWSFPTPAAWRRPDGRLGRRGGGAGPRRDRSRPDPLHPDRGNGPGSTGVRPRHRPGDLAGPLLGEPAALRLARRLYFYTVTSLLRYMFADRVGLPGRAVRHRGDLHRPGVGLRPYLRTGPDDLAGVLHGGGWSRAAGVIRAAVPLHDHTHRHRAVGHRPVGRRQPGEVGDHDPDAQPGLLHRAGHRAAPRLDPRQVPAVTHPVRPADS